MTERITRGLIKEGLENGVIRVEMEEDRLTAHIGTYWFYICPEAGKTEKDFTPEELIRMIWESVNGYPINDDNEEEATECLYYKAVLEESVQNEYKNMEPAKYPIAMMLCGECRSTGDLTAESEFIKKFLDAQEILTLKGYIVNIPEIFNIEKYRDKAEFTGMLRKMHRQKIDMADRVFIFNPDGHIREDVKREIEYAKEKGKPVELLDIPPVNKTSVKYSAQEHMYDMADINNHMWPYLDDDEQEKLRSNEDFINEAAYALRTNQNNGMSFEDALKKAFDDTKRHYV